jgi:hypothetical protein
VNYSNYKAEFDSIVDKYCNVLALNQSECFPKLQEFDKALDRGLSANRSENYVENKKRSCIYSADRKTIEPFLHHTYFHFKIGDTRMKRFMQLNVMSFLATQNLQCTRLIIWVLKEFNNELKVNFNKLFNAFISNRTIELKVFDMQQLCNYRNLKSGILYSSFENHQICKYKNSFVNYKHSVLSDFVRFIVLDVFGGIYVDGDVMFLKDTRILWNENFAYRWSSQDYYNTGLNYFIILNVTSLTSSS